MLKSADDPEIPSNDEKAADANEARKRNERGKERKRIESNIFPRFTSNAKDLDLQIRGGLNVSSTAAACIGRPCCE
ncbi:hypothetical protein M758_UG144100 [Ceratodon purpureus]|nr:hypothetical protein M758_UG144100 [Ceratodon purpureus]